MERRPGALTLDDDDRRVLSPWAADCAERVLVLFEAKVPGDLRPRAALHGVRSFARGEKRIGEVRALSAAAHAAARSVGDAAAVAAARAAGHAAGTAHMAAHARGAAAYAALAAGLAAPDNAHTMAEEAAWQLAHASADVLDVLRRLPSPPSAGGKLAFLIAEQHARVIGRP